MEIAPRVIQQGRRCMVVLPGPARLDDVLAAIRESGGTLVSVTPEKGSLEDIFLNETNSRSGEPREGSV